MHSQESRDSLLCIFMCIIRAQPLFLWTWKNVWLAILSTSVEEQYKKKLSRVSRGRLLGENRVEWWRDEGGGNQDKFLDIYREK